MANKLNAKRFNIPAKDTSVFFGDCYCIFSNDFFQLRFSKSKSFETVDIQSNQSSEVWYDLALVKALLYSEKNLNYMTTIETHKDFLFKELTNIVELFSRENYLTTKKRLNELVNERVEQMFPFNKKVK